MRSRRGAIHHRPPSWQQPLKSLPKLIYFHISKQNIFTGKSKRRLIITNSLSNFPTAITLSGSIFTLLSQRLVTKCIPPELLIPPREPYLLHVSVTVLSCINPNHYFSDITPWIPVISTVTDNNSCKILRAGPCSRAHLNSYFIVVTTLNSVLILAYVLEKIL